MPGVRVAIGLNFANLCRGVGLQVETVVARQTAGEEDK
jgi:hypothetical protein